MQALVAVGTALLSFLGHYDWSALGPWAALVPTLVALATEAFNQALATPTASDASKNIIKALVLFALVAGLALLGAQSPAGAATMKVNRPHPIKATQPPPGCSASDWASGSCPSAVAPTPSPTSAPTPAPSLQVITVADLQNAIALAAAQVPPDTRHGQCWNALLPIAQNFQTSTILPNQPGLATLVQTYFDDKNLVTNGSPALDAVAIGCALTVLDLKVGFVQLLSAVGATALVVPKMPVIP